MAKHAQDKQAKGPSKEERKRLLNLEKIDGLFDAAAEDLKRCLGAVKPCIMCNKDGISMQKNDANGKCLWCHGSHLLPDEELRKIARAAILERSAPAPKVTEMSIDPASQADEWAKKVEMLSDSELDKLTKDLGLVFDGTGKGENSGSSAESDITGVVPPQ